MLFLYRKEVRKMDMYLLGQILPIAIFIVIVVKLLKGD